METIFQWFEKRQDLSQIVLIGTLIMFRVIPVTFLTPFLGGKLVPPETRIAFAFGLAVLSFRYAEGFMSGPLALNPLVYLVLMFKELFLGYVLGFIATRLFYAMEMGGRMLDVMRGSNMAEVQVPELDLRASPLGEFKFQLLLIVYIGIDGHHYFIEALVDTFRVVPVDGWPTMRGGFATFVDEILRYSGTLFSVAFALVFPGLFATFMTDIVFGMLNRVSPQLNAYFMAMGVKAMAGIAMFFFALSLMLTQLVHLATQSLVFLRHLISLLS